MLLIKYVSDKYGDSDDFAPPVTIPMGASFKDMIALKGKSDIDDKINTQIIQPPRSAEANSPAQPLPACGDRPPHRCCGRQRHMHAARPALPLRAAA